MITVSLNDIAYLVGCAVLAIGGATIVIHEILIWLDKKLG